MSASRPGVRWTPEQDRILIKYLEQKMSMGLIAREFGITRNMVIGRLWRMRRAAKKKEG